MTPGGQRSIPAALWLFFAELLLIVLLVPGGYMRNVVDTEQRWLFQDLSNDTALWVQGKAVNWYTHSVVQSGLLDATYDHLVPNQAQRDRSGGMRNLGYDTWFPTVESRLQAIFAAVYQIFQRLALLTAWAPFLAITAVPAVFDGMVRWRIRRETFAFTSSDLHHVASTTVTWTLWAVPLLLFLPAPVSPNIIPILAIILPMALAHIVVHTPKRL